MALARAAHQAVCTSRVFSHGAPWRSLVERRLPALSSFLGQRPAQETRWAAVGKRLMSGPISARMTAAESALTPGMVVSRAAASRNGFEALAQLGVDLGDGGVDRIRLAEVDPEQQTLMVG